MAPTIDTNGFRNIRRSAAGFTLLELTVTMAIFAALGAMAYGLYANYARAFELDAARDALVSDIRIARDNAMNGNGGRNWGIRFTDAAEDSYAIFSTPTDWSDPAKTVVATTTFAGGIGFSPASPADILFFRPHGFATGTTVGIARGSETRTVTVSANGLTQ